MTYEFFQGKEEEFQLLLSEMNDGMALAAHSTSSESNKRLLRRIVDANDSTRVMELLAMLLPQNQMLSFFVARVHYTNPAR